MGEAGTEKLVLDVLRRNRYCTLATASSDGKPQAAVMQYAEEADGRLYFFASADSRKYPNIIGNPRSSIVVFNPPDYVQMDGLIEELHGPEARIGRQRLLDKHGQDSSIPDDARCRYFCFTPQWMRVRLDPDFPGEYAVAVRNPK